MKNIVVGFFLCLLLAGVGYSGYYIGHQKGFNEGNIAGYKLGYTAGRTPMADDIKQQNQRENAINDLFNITTDYKQMSDLCEQKYQYGLSGSYSEALQVKGQMTALQQQIDAIMSKYGNTSQSQQNNAALQ